MAEREMGDVAAGWVGVGGGDVFEMTAVVGPISFTADQIPVSPSSAALPRPSTRWCQTFLIRWDFLTRGGGWGSLK